MTEQINVALVSDFCYPFLGGIEIHTMKLAQKLKQKIKKVIIITHQYPGHVGVMEVKGIKIYYLKLPYHKDLNIIYATYCFNHFKIKRIFDKEKINLVHCHQSTSCLSLQTTLYSGVLGLKVIHTEHSLFTFKQLFDIHMNKFLQIISVLYNRVICVSRTTRNNYLLRSNIQYEKLIVIPNAAQIKSQIPTQSIQQTINDQKYTKNDQITLIFVGRLTYRRGVDLLIDILEDFFQRYPEVKLKIIGEGVKMPVLKKFIQEKKLTSSVQLLGRVQNQNVIKIMQKCHIYINTPVTESFGIALVEAACEGLLCVSTQVGGITQSLPKSLLISVKPTKNAFILGLIEAVQRIKSGVQVSHKKQMNLIKNYTWENISARVLEVYKQVHQNQQAITRIQVVKKTIKKGRIIGFIMLVWFLILCLVNDFHDKLTKYKKQPIEAQKSL